MGIPDRRLPVLYARLDGLFAELEAYPGLSPRHIASLRRRLPEFKQLCQQLYAFPIPAALEHGDLWWGNIFIHEQSPIFFDWSDASLTHPFFGLAMLLQEDLAHVFDEADLNAIKRSYFVTFRGFGSEAVLDKAMAMAKTLAPLHFASHYHDLILPQLAARWELENMVPYFLNKLRSADEVGA
jgi:aminoglycoside phosphotransferase (APT) family kinase protein